MNAVPPLVRTALTALTLALAVLAGGCGNINQIDAAQPPVTGLADVVSPDAPLRIFMIHGMTGHHEGWGRPYLSALAARMTWSFSAASLPWQIVEVEGWGFDYHATITVYSAREGTQIRLVAYEVTWSRLTRDFKAQRFAGDNAVHRTVVSQLLKEKVLADGLSEAVMYLRRFDHDILGRSVTAALRAFYEQRFDPPGAAPVEHAPVAFISESLGSYMLFEALVNEASDSTRQERFDRMRTNTRKFYMMSNQLPLLAIEDTSGLRGKETQTSSSYAALRVLAGPAPKAPKPPVDLVVFSDPNDVLSYQLFSKDVQEMPGIVLHDFTPRNATRWFGLFVNPWAAHVGYSANADVLKIMTDGYPAKTSRR